MKRYDFANILFAGPCNLRCPYCIGRQLDPALSRNNLDEFPPRNLDAFVALLKAHRVTEVTFTGATTDPQLYRYEDDLLDWLRARLPPETRFSLHTNGLLALRKMRTFNRYDRVSISFPSFDHVTYQKMTGSSHMPDLAEIIRQANVPIKLSCIINEHNVGHVDKFLERCKALGVRRVVFRKLYGPQPAPRDDASQEAILHHLPQKSVYRGNPVYDYAGIQVTYWDFRQTTSTALNLFSDGTISPEYLLARASSHAWRRGSSRGLQSPCS